MQEINLEKILNAINTRYTGNTTRITALKAMRKAVELALDEAASEVKKHLDRQEMPVLTNAVDRTILAVKTRIK